MKFDPENQLIVTKSTIEDFSHTITDLCDELMILIRLAEAAETHLETLEDLDYLCDAIRNCCLRQKQKCAELRYRKLPEILKIVQQVSDRQLKTEDETDGSAQSEVNRMKRRLDRNDNRMIVLCGSLNAACDILKKSMIQIGASLDHDEAG